MSRWLHGVRAMFFDAVGTVLFPEPDALAVYAEVARRRGLMLSDAAIRDRFIEAYRREEAADRAAGWVTSEARERDRWHAIVTATLRGVDDVEACFTELYDHFAHPSAWALADDLVPVLDALTRRGLVLGIGSNYDARLWPVLDGFPELKPLWEHVVISSDVRFRKPGTGFFAAVVKRAGCEPEEVLFVGDDLDNDYIGATAAGLRAVLLDRSDRYRHIENRIRRHAELLE